MGFRAVAVTALLAFVSGCARSAPPPDASGDRALTAAIHAYVVEFLRRNPTTNTYLGGAGLDPSLHDADGTLRDYAPAAIAAEDQWLATTETTTTAIAPDTLSPGSRIDRDVALAQIAFQRRQHQKRRYQERALDTYVVESFRAIDWQLQGMTSTGPTTYGRDDEWALVERRLRAVPAYLQTAETQLAAGVASGHVPDPRMIRRDGITSSESTAAYFRDTLPGLAALRVSGPNRTAIVGGVNAASRAAAEAYQRFRDAVARLYFTDRTARALQPRFAGDAYAMGEAEYDWALTNNFRLTTRSAALYDEAWPIVQATQTRMIELARAIGAAHGWPLPADGGQAVRVVFDQLSKDAPKSDDEMIGWYRDAAFRLVDFARTTRLFAVPSEYRLEVVQTPPPLEASIDGASYYPAPPFTNSGVGRYYVTATHNDPAALAANNRASIADLSAHEGFPGHDWYFKLMTKYRDLISPVRWLTPGAVEDSSAMWQDSLSGEGWGLYAEALMAEPQPDAPNGFYTPEERLYQLQGQLYRDLRVRIDTGLHTGRLSYDAAVTLFSEVVDFLPGDCQADAKTLAPTKRASCAAAERAIFRYSKWPTQAITYRLGKDQIYALRETATRALGAAFSLEAFHLAFIQQGTIPSGYFGDELIRQLRR